MFLIIHTCWTGTLVTDQKSFFIVGILKCEWRWHRFEWQSRSSIHAHDAAKFKNDPGLIQLTNNVYIGREALKKKLSRNKEP